MSDSIDSFVSGLINDGIMGLVEYNEEDNTLYIQYNNLDFDRIIVTKAESKDCKTFYSDQKCGRWAPFPPLTFTNFFVIIYI